MSMIKKLLVLAARIGALQAKCGPRQCDTLQHGQSRMDTAENPKIASGMTARGSIYTFGGMESADEMASN
jgi:hypothetical protein